MLRGIGLGTYRPGTSIAHRLDGRTKVIAAAGATVAAFAAVHFYYFGVIIALLIIASLVAQLDVRKLAQSMGIVLIFLLISTFIAALFIPGKVQVRIGPIPISHDGVTLGSRTFCQSFILIFATQVLTSTTAPFAITTALQRLLGWSRRFGVPVDELAMLITLSLTFLPLIREQIQTVIDAQLARGVDLRRGTLEVRLRSLLSFFNPIISANLRRADELATAMEARGYRVGAPRTHLRVQRFGAADYVLLVCVALLIVGAVLA